MTTKLKRNRKDNVQVFRKLFSRSMYAGLIDRTLKTVLWTMISLTACGLLLFHLYTVISTYLLFLTTVKITIVQETETAFPAVTVCNVNPVKASKLNMSQELVDLLFDEGTRKRLTDISVDCTLGFEGVCYSVLDLTTRMNYTEAVSGCAAIGASMYIAKSTDVETSLANSYILNDTSFDRFWTNIGYRNLMGRLYSNSYENYATNGYANDDWVVVRKSDYKWESTNESITAGVVCQLLTTCQTPMYTAPDGSQYCWFLPYDNQKATFWHATEACPIYSQNSYLIELETQEKADFFVNTSGVIDGLNGDIYWLALSMVEDPGDANYNNGSGTWLSSGEINTYANWDTAFGEPDLYLKHEVVAIMNRSHTWKTICSNCTGENNPLAYVVCEIKFPGADMETTVTPQPQDLVTGEIQPPLQGGSYSETVLQIIREPVTPEFVIEESFIESFATIDTDTKMAMGYSSLEFILDCRFEGWHCENSMFYQIHDPLFGNCYVFNSGWDSSVPIETSHRTGRRYGLWLVLDIGEDEYIRQIGGASGAKVIVHDGRTMPHADEDGYMVEPGKLTSIGVRKVTLSRKPEPYGNCTNAKKLEKIDMYSEKYDFIHYRQKSCLRTCYQKEVIARCGCADAYFLMEGRALGAAARNIKPCQTTNREQDDCKYQVNAEYAAGLLGCNDKCPLPCYEEYFTSSISTAAWPSINHLDDVLAKYTDQNSETTNSNNSLENQRDLLSVEVFYDDFNYEKIEEAESYKTGQFLSDFGGILGLWIGFSVMTIFEFLELGLDIIVYGIMNVTKYIRRQSKLTDSTTTLNPKPDTEQQVPDPKLRIAWKKPMKKRPTMIKRKMWMI